MTDELISPIPLETPKPIPADAIDSDAPAIERPGHRARTRFFVAFLISLLAGLAVGTGALYAYDREYTGRVLPGVSVGGVDLSGLSSDAAAAKLHDAYDHFGEGRAVVVGGGFEMPIDYAKIDRRANVDQMVAEALAVGRSGNLAERVILDARTAIRGEDLAPLVLFDEARLARYVQTYAARLQIDAENAAVVEKDGAFVVVEGTEGQVADRISPTEFLTAALSRTDAPAELRVELEVAPIEPDVTTAEAEAALAEAKVLAADIPVVAGEEAWTIPAATIQKWITFASDTNGRYGPVVSQPMLTASLTTLASEVAIKGRSPA